MGKGRAWRERRQFSAKQNLKLVELDTVTGEQATLGLVDTTQGETVVQLRRQWKAGLVAMVRPVRPWPYRCLSEKNGVAWIRLRVLYRMASPCKRFAVAWDV